MADEIVDLGTGTETVDPGTSAVETVDTTGRGTETVAPEPDEFTPLESLYADLGKDETAEVVDPNALPTIPEEFSKLLTVSDYIKEPTHLESAIAAATAVWD